MQWTDALKVGLDVIDRDHEDFVLGLNEAAAASDAEFPRHFAELVEHTVAHFSREEAIMDATGFVAADMHKAEHRRVIDEVEAVSARLTAGDISAARAFVAEALPAWFLQHRNTMDLVTASFALQRGWQK